jgi:hypothetical protein
MKRDNLIQRLVERKLKDKIKVRNCVCFNLALCFARGQRTAQAGSRS